MRISTLIIPLLTMAKVPAAFGFAPSKHHFGGIRHSMILPAATTASAYAPTSIPVADDSAGASAPEFPAPLSAADRLKRSIKFWLASAPIAADYFALMANLKIQDLLGNENHKDDIETLWEAQHADGAKKLHAAISDLKGFYVKGAQIVSTRPDLFPKEYTDLLSEFSDNLDPMPLEIAKAVVEQELLSPGEKFEHVFQEFDGRPLGAASIAQVHRAVLTDKYGGREVAVKIQRPSIESKLLGDVANLKAIAKTFRNVESLPFDYYTVFSELETQLAKEFDFTTEANSMERVYNSLATSLDGTKAADIPITMPRPVRGLVSQRVLVMDYLEGMPLSRLRDSMDEEGFDKSRFGAKMLGSKLIDDLTNTFGRNILEEGFFHADPHPGNIFLLENGDVGLIDFGQVKQITRQYRETLAKIMVALDENDGSPEHLKAVGNLVLELGIELKDDAHEYAAAAFAMWLFDGSVEHLPGGFENKELSPNAPVKSVKSFPQDLVLVARSSVLIKALARRFGISWSLAQEWAPITRAVLGLPPKEGKALRRRQKISKRIKKWGLQKFTRVARKLKGTSFVQ